MVLDDTLSVYYSRTPIKLSLSGDPDRYHSLTLTLLKASWRRSQRLVAERRTAIVKVAEAMLAATDERVSGEQ